MDTISIEDRMRGAIWGQLVGDAAALGTHWIYDLNELKRIYPEEIKGFEAPKPKHYHAKRRPGDFTHYGDAAFEMLQTVAECQGFSPIDFRTRFLKKFSSPNYDGYIDSATRITLQNYQAFLDEHPDDPLDFHGGADDDQMGAASRLAPVFAFHQDDPKLLVITELATTVTQNNERAVAYMHAHARITRDLLHGEDLLKAFEKEASPREHDTPLERHVRDQIREAIKLRSLSITEATLKFGQQCPLDHSFPASVQAVIKQQNSYQDGILETIRAGGDNAGRASLVGTWLGAHLGISAIPEEWRKRLNAYTRINQYIEKIVSRKLIKAS